MTCQRPLELAQLVDYWTADLPESEILAIEAHIFECDRCAAEAQRIAKIAAAFRTGLPPVITRAEVSELKSKGLVIEENDFHPGTGKTVTFARGLDLMVHHLVGLDLASAERVALTIRSEGTGMIIHHDPLAPFDAARGEILIACQRHYSALPPDVVFDVEVHHRAAPPTISTYAIPHVFA